MANMPLNASEYVQSQLVRSMDRLRPYVQSSSNFDLPTRNAFIRFSMGIKNFLGGQREERWSVMPGLSGVGKTTILAQIYFRFRSVFAPNHILFVSMDEASLLGFTLNDLLSAYEAVLGSSFESVTSPILLLIDEVHRDHEWASALKVLYGRSKNIYIICTGSSALLIRAQSEDIGRRITEEKLYPMNFTEFQMLKNNKYPMKGLATSIKEALYGSSSAKEVHEHLLAVSQSAVNQWSKYDRLEVEDYLNKGTMPFAIRLADDARVYQKMDRIIDKVIQTDVAELGQFDSDTVMKIKSLLLILAQSSTVSYVTLTSRLMINARTLQKMLDVLIKAEVLIPAEPYRAPKKPSKYLFMCPLIRRSLLDITGLAKTEAGRRGSVLEDVMAMHLYREFIGRGTGKLSYDAAEGGADFILELRSNKRLAIEIGAGAKGVGQVLASMTKDTFDYGLVFGERPLAVDETERVVTVPLDYLWLI